jgi:hypothetical protein
MHAGEDYAHAAAVERILRAYGVTPTLPSGGGLSRRGRPLWGGGPAITGIEENLRAPGPQTGGC